MVEDLGLLRFADRHLRQSAAFFVVFSQQRLHGLGLNLPVFRLDLPAGQQCVFGHVLSDPLRQGCHVLFQVGTGSGGGRGKGLINPAGKLLGQKGLDLAPLQLKQAVEPEIQISMLELEQLSKQVL